MRPASHTAIKRPLILYFIVAAYVIAPFANVLLVSFFNGVPISATVRNLFAAYGSLAAIWLLTAPLVGIGFYFVKRISWYAFLAHSCLILVDFGAKWIMRPSYYRATMANAQIAVLAAGNLALIVVVGLVVRKNFRAPYLQVLPRSWRESERIPIRHWIKLNGEDRRITDISAGGCFVAEPDLEVRVGDRVSVKFESDSLTIECDADIIRRSRQGIGLRFLSLPQAKRRDIQRMLKKRFPLRYETDLQCVWRCKTTTLQGRLLNISGGGCYIHADVDELSEKMFGEVEVADVKETVRARIVWINRAQKHEKPVGFGVQFLRRQWRLVLQIRRKFVGSRLTR